MQQELNAIKHKPIIISSICNRSRSGSFVDVVAAGMQLRQLWVLQAPRGVHARGQEDLHDIFV